MLKIKSTRFQYIELELNEYHQSLREIEKLRLDIIHGAGMSDDENIGGGRSSAISDPTARKGTALTTNVKLERLERVTNAITFVVSGLSAEKRRFVQMMYWDRPKTLTLDGIALKLNVVRLTASRWRKEIVNAIAVQMGHGH